MTTHIHKRETFIKLLQEHPEIKSMKSVTPKRTEADRQIESQRIESQS